MKILTGILEAYGVAIHDTSTNFSWTKYQYLKVRADNNTYLLFNCLVFKNVNSAIPCLLGTHVKIGYRGKTIYFLESSEDFVSDVDNLFKSSIYLVFIIATLATIFQLFSMNGQWWEAAGIGAAFLWLAPRYLISLFKIWPDRAARKASKNSKKSRAVSVN